MKILRQPLLTIAIPTYARSQYLNLCLKQFHPDRAIFSKGTIELLILDNCSPDDTPEVIMRHQREGLSLRNIRHDVDIGSDRNFAKCFELARGRYVQILGDDDLYLPGMLQRLVNELEAGDHGVLVLKSYGYENDFSREYPGGKGGRKEFEQIAPFLSEVGQLITFISACVINKEIQKEVDPSVYCGSHLVQVHLVILAMLRVPSNLFLTDYYLACKRGNSGGYDFSEVFVERLFGILRSYREAGLSREAIESLSRSMLIAFYPFSLLRVRLENKQSLEAARRRFESEFGHILSYSILNAPIIFLPRWIAILWGVVVVAVGRVLKGDIRRGIHFFKNRLRVFS